jgi:hypothetical protein
LARIPGSHPGDPGSIPGKGEFFFFPGHKQTNEKEREKKRKEAKQERKKKEQKERPDVDLNHEPTG